jgi:perosamine synthetase
MSMKHREVGILRPRVGQEEAQAVYDVIMSGQLCEGPKVREFEEAFASFIGARHAVVCFNGTVALHLLWLSLGIGPGDEVIIPSLTFISTAVSLLYVGAKPVFAEIEPEMYCMDPQDAARRITPRTRAIMPVHYGGQVSRMDEFTKLCRDSGLILCEDAAEAAGAHLGGRFAGTFGSVSIFSFTPSKNITTGEGGMVVTDNADLARRIRMLKNHGQDCEYNHLEVGYNYRMTEMQAAIGLVQLGKFKEILRIKERHALYYTSILSQFPGIMPPVTGPERNHTYMIYTFRIDPGKIGMSRDEIMKKLRERGIQAKIYFPPAHLQPVFKSMGYKEGDLPVTEEIARTIISLPVHSMLTEEDLRYVGDSLDEILADR